MDILREVTGVAGGEEGEPDSGYIPKGKARTLGTRKGKPDVWFTDGGYTQLQFPVADDIYGPGDKPDLEVKKKTRPTNVSLSGISNAEEIKPL